MTNILGTISNATDLNSLISTAIQAQGTAGENLALNAFVYINTDGKWYNGLNNGTALQANVTGVTVAAISSGATGTINIGPLVLTNSGWALTPGDIYIGPTIGSMTQTQPAAGSYCKSLGCALTATSIFFFPSLGWLVPTTPTISTGWSATHITTLKSMDADTCTLTNLVNVVGTLITSLQTTGILGL